MATPAATLAILVSANTTQANAALGRTDAHLKSTAATGTKASAVLKKAMLGVGIAAAGAGVALVKIGKDFDDAYNTIRVGTGATGRELKKLEGSFKSVVKDVPSSFDDASTAIADLNTRLGLSGKPLERMTKQMTELSRITETSVEGNIESVSKAFVDWEIATKDQTKTLDGFFRLSQASGMAVADIAANIQKFGSPLRQLGFSLEESAAMFASFERAGVNIQTMVPGLKLAISNLTRPTAGLAESMDKMGISVGKPDKALREVFDLMTRKGIPDIEKTGLAMDVFGKRAGADMAEAIKQGRFELDDFMKVMTDGEDTIRKAGRETMQFSDHWQKFTNRLKVLVEPVATRVFGAVGDEMKALTKILGDKRLSGQERLDALMDRLGALVERLGTVVAKALPTIVALGAKTARAFVEGLLNAGIWGQAALGAIIFKLLGGTAVIKAAAAAGAATSGSWVAGAKAGLLRAGVMGVGILGGIALLDALFGRNAGEKATAEAEAMVGDLQSSIDSFSSKQATGKLQDIADEATETAGHLRTLQEAFGSVDNAAIESFENTAESSKKEMARIIRAFRDVREEIHRLKVGFNDNLDSIRDKTAVNMAKIEEKLDIHSWRGKRAIELNMKATVTAIEDAMDRGNIKTREGMTAINQAIRDALKTYGITGADAEKIIKAKKDPGSATGLQRGAYINEGRPSGDSVPAMLERGEYVLNRKAVAAVGRGKLDAINFGVAKRFQQGGIVELLGPHNDPAGHGGSNMHLHIAMLNGIVGLGRKLEQLGWIISGHSAWGGATPGVHAPNSYHYRDMAIDANWPNAAEEFAKIRALLPMLEGGRFGAFGGAELKLPRFDTAFATYTPAVEGLNNLARGLEKEMGGRLGSLEGAEAGVGISGDGSVERIAARVARQRSTSKVATLAAGMAGYAESGMQNLSHGHSTSKGPLQLLASTAAALGVSPNDTAAVFDLFFGRGFFGKGGANTLAAQGLPAHLVAQGVQGSAFSSGSNYLAQKGAAQAWMQRFGLRGGGLVQMFAKGGAVKGRNALEQARSVFQRVGRITGRVGRIDERIDLAETLARLETSPEGVELSGGERGKLIGLHERLLGKLELTRDLTGQGLGITARGLTRAKGPVRDRLKRLRQDFRGTLTDVVGLTGKGGRIFDTQLAIAELKRQPTAEVPEAAVDPGHAERIRLLEELLRASRMRESVSAAQLPVFSDFFPKLHDGGIYRAPIGHSEGPAMLRDGERVLSDGQVPVEVTVIVEDEAVDASRIRVVVNDQMARMVRGSKGLTPGRTYTLG